MDIRKIQAILDDRAAQVTDGLGVYFKDLVTGEEAGIRPDVPYPTASVFKIFVLADLVRKIQAGELRWTDRYELQKDRRTVGSGVLRCLDDGLAPTLRDLATLMMIISDNTAADLLFGLTGRESIQRNVLEPLGLKNTRIDLDCAGLLGLNFGCPIDLSYEEQIEQIAKKAFISAAYWNTAPYRNETELNNVTSARDVAVLLEKFYRSEWVNEAACRDAIGIMLRCQTNSRIPKYLWGVPVAHKTGSCDKVANDCGIVYTKKGDYVLCLLYDGNIDSEEMYRANAGGFLADAMLADLSRAIYREYIS